MIASATLMSAPANIRAASTKSRFRSVAWSRSRGAELDNRVAGEEQCGGSLLASERLSADRARSLHLDEVARVLRRGERRRWRRRELERAPHEQRRHESEPRIEHRGTGIRAAWVARHWAPVGWVKIGASRPSCARSEIRLSAARIPKAMPFVWPFRREFAPANWRRPRQVWLRAYREVGDQHSWAAATACRLRRAGMRRALVEAVRLVPPLDADYGVIDGCLERTP